ncbi:MAG: histidine kinase [Actinomycetota bacterium]|nr:histidine kinase [Actinomycetota bacterium]
MEQAVVASDGAASGRRVRAVWAAAACIVVLVAFSGYLTVLSGGTRAGHVILYGGAALVALAAGVLISVRRAGNLVGLFLVGHAFVLALDVTASYAVYGLIAEPGSLPGASWAALFSSSTWPAFYAGLVAVLMVFPDGRLPSRRWRPVAIGAAASIVGLMVVLAFLPEPLETPFAAVERPLPTLPEALDPVFVPFLVGTLASLFAAAWAVRVRFRRAAGVERQQLLWLAYGALSIPATLLVCGVDQVVTGDASWLTGAAMAVMELAVPISIAVAILRYGLFDIEPILNRTLVYGVLTACVVAIYVAVVGGLSSVLDSRGWLGLIATGIVAIGIQPLRQRVQKRVDRMIYGDRNDPYAALARLGDRLQATLVSEAVTESIVETVADALRVSYAAIEFERDGEFELVAAHGSRGNGIGEDIPLVYQGKTIGRLAVQAPPGRTLTAADRRLLADLAHHAGVALHAVRLTTDLQRSRERLVSTREEERRRLRRDLHDSLGPTLAGMAFRLDAAGNQIDSDPRAASRAIRELRNETQEAIGDIRRVAHELRPPALDELGLVSALRAHAERISSNGAGLQVSVEAPEPFPELPAAVEVAAYRIVLEAMTNVSRHAHAGRCRVDLEIARGLRIVVADDGVGLDGACEAGVGLASMRERAEELGGRVEVGSGEGGGTRVAAELPIGAKV